MNTPPGLLGAALIFWGYEAGFLAIGLALAAILEAPRWMERRWDPSPEEFNQLWNITVLLFVGAATYVFASSDGLGTVGSFFSARSFTDRSHALDRAAETVITFLRWLPPVFFPFTAAQAFSTQRKIEFRTFSWFMRRRARGQPGPSGPSGRGVNTAFPFFGLCLVAASSTNQGEVVFYAGASALVAWACWTVRSPRVSWPVWAALVLVAIGLGFLGSQGLRELKRAVDALHVRMLSGLGVKGRNLREAQTAIGQVGRLKSSGRVVLRVEIPPGGRMTHLLREATFDLYRWPEWRVGGGTRDFAQIFPAGTNESAWSFVEAPSSQVVRIASYLEGGQGTISLPHGVTQVENLGVFDLKTNRLGTARVDTGPGLVVYTAHSGSAATFDGAPDDRFDLLVPASEEPALARIVAELKLLDLPEAARPRALERFFAQHFSYSLYQDGRVLETNREIRTPLAHFLLQSRVGHCEYFATATTLLLRQAGIPARYALGYSVQENAGKQRFVVRARHAHAWCLYYDRTAKLWRELDTTPGTWLALEAEQRSLLEPLTDAFSWLWFQFSKWRWGMGNARMYVFYGVAAGVVLLVSRFALKKRTRSASRRSGEWAPATRAHGSDSEFYLLEQRLVAQGLTRRSSEPLYPWLQRIQEHLPLDAAELKVVVDLHYRLRFDPKGLTEEERTRLRQQALALLERTAPVQSV